MTTPVEIAARKRIAAEAAVLEVQAGMLVGLGTGSTAAFAIAALGRRVAAGLDMRAVATSKETAARATAAGIAVVDLATVSAVDLAIDGVDEIDPGFRAIKGAGGAMLREKIVAQAAARMIAIADDSKAVAVLGARPVPVEILGEAEAFASARIRALGSNPVLRRRDRAAWLTDQGNPILDCRFAAASDFASVAAMLEAIPGVLGHGLFLTEIDALYLGGADGLRVAERPRTRD